MNKTYVGIDFSMNSTGLAILEDNKWKFANFPRDNKQFNKEPFKSMPIDVVINTFPKVTTKNYQEDQIIKLKDSIFLSKMIMNYIKENTKVEYDLKIGIEGISFGSKGSSTIDIGGYQWILRSMFYNDMNKEVMIFAPQTIKKYAGGGRMNKEAMIEKWFEIKNDSLNESEFWIWAKKLIDEGGKLKKPMDDMVDATWIVKTLQNF